MREAPKKILEFLSFPKQRRKTDLYSGSTMEAWTDDAIIDPVQDAFDLWRILGKLEDRNRLEAHRAWHDAFDMYTHAVTKLEDSAPLETRIEEWKKKRR